MVEASQATAPWLPTAVKPECPVGPPVQLWIESSIRWFGTEFGPEPLLRDIVLPGDLPPSAAASAEQIGVLVDRACDQMSVDRTGLRLELFDGSVEKKMKRSGQRRRVGHFRMEGGRPVIAVDLAEAADPAYVMAIIAYELCYVRLLGEGRIESTRPDQERLTDLLTVYFGFGAVAANGAYSYATGGRSWSVDARSSLDERTLNAARNDGYRRLGYQNEREFGYALACYGQLRHEPDPAWAGYLNPRARDALRQGLAYLAAVMPERDLPTERGSIIPLNAVKLLLPSFHALSEVHLLRHSCSLRLPAVPPGRGAAGKVGRRRHPPGRVRLLRRWSRRHGAQLRRAVDLCLWHVGIGKRL